MAVLYSIILAIGVLRLSPYLLTCRRKRKDSVQKRIEVIDTNEELI